MILIFESAEQRQRPTEGQIRRMVSPKVAAQPKSNATICSGHRARSRPSTPRSRRSSPRARSPNPSCSVNFGRGSSAGVILGFRPGARPRTRAPHGRVRALADHPRSNSAKEPSICISMRDRFELTSEAIRSRSPECENGTRPILYPVEQHAKRYHINWVLNQLYLGNERFYTRT